MSNIKDKKAIMKNIRAVVHLKKKFQISYFNTSFIWTKINKSNKLVFIFLETKLFLIKLGTKGSLYQVYPQLLLDD